MFLCERLSLPSSSSLLPPSGLIAPTRLKMREEGGELVGSASSPAITHLNGGIRVPLDSQMSIKNGNETIGNYRHLLNPSQSVRPSVLDGDFFLPPVHSLPSPLTIR